MDGPAKLPQTIHHTEAALSNVSALPILLRQQPFPPTSTLPRPILVSFSSLSSHMSAQIDFPSPYLCISFLYSPTLDYYSYFSL